MERCFIKDSQSQASPRETGEMVLGPGEPSLASVPLTTLETVLMLKSFSKTMPETGLDGSTAEHKQAPRDQPKQN